MCACVLELPGLGSAVVSEARVVVAFVEVFQDAGEDFGLFVWEVDALAWGLEGGSWAGCGGACGLGFAVGGEEGGCAEDGFVGGEEALFGTHAEHYDRAAGGGAISMVGLVSGLWFLGSVLGLSREGFPWDGIDGYIGGAI